ncbi:exonuclease domain-containing protein [uncultured Sphingobium sp.]|uniref:exonuclease domain-containing protein n=1 Tax=uncultured Sphingobium sp. TaxID=316087 RepID=UPI00259BA688|nr:exonuclease domain-containing protein [uncultured Sphingobium sp.]
MNAVNDRHAHAAELLSAHPDFRVQRRLMPVTTFHEAVPFVPNRIGVAIDVETTGLNHDADRIIELAMQRFRFDARGRIIQVGTPRVWREDCQTAFKRDPRSASKRDPLFR